MSFLAKRALAEKDGAKGASSMNPFASSEPSSKKSKVSSTESSTSPSNSSIFGSGGSTGGIFGQQTEPPKFSFAKPTFQLPAVGATKLSPAPADQSAPPPASASSVSSSSSALPSASEKPKPIDFGSSSVVDSSGVAEHTALQAATASSVGSKSKSSSTISSAPFSLSTKKSTGASSFADIADSASKKNPSSNTTQVVGSRTSAPNEVAQTSDSNISPGSKSFGKHFSPFKFAQSSGEAKLAGDSGSSTTTGAHPNSSAAGSGIKPTAPASPPPEALLTGEEDEEVLFQTRGRLYVVEKAKDGAGEWNERGTGQLRVNKAKDHPNRFRMVMRRDGVFRVILNAAIWADMSIQRANERSIRFLAVENDEPRPFLVRLAKEEDADALLRTMERCKRQAQRKEDQVNK